MKKSSEGKGIKEKNEISQILYKRVYMDEISISQLGLKSTEYTPHYKNSYINTK